MKRGFNLFFVISLVTFVSSCDNLHEPVADLTKPVYFADVKAIFNANNNQCSQCHYAGSPLGGKVKNSSGKVVDTDSFSDVKLWVNTTDYKESYLYLALNPKVKGSLADMTKNATSLTKDQIAIINKWLADGAPEK